MNHHLNEGTSVALSQWVRGANGPERRKDVAATVTGFIAGGGQGDVYAARCGRELALKHLYGRFATDPMLYFKKTVCLSTYPAPHPDIVWPLLVSPELTDGGSFVYAMEKLEGYEEASAVISVMKKRNGGKLLGEVNDPGWKPHWITDANDPAALTVAQRAELIAHAADMFAAIHRSGMIYGDVAGKNLLYRVRADGHLDVKLIDAENLIPSGQCGQYPRGYTLGLVGSGQYPAPEVLTGESVPTIHADLHSLGVLAFRIFCGSHPLDGARVHSAPYTDENIRRFFGDEAEFTVTSRQNAASPAVMSHFQALPEQVQAYFRVLFHPDILHSRAHADPADEPRPTAEILARILRKNFPSIR